MNLEKSKKIFAIIGFIVIIIFSLILNNGNDTQYSVFLTEQFKVIVKGKEDKYNEKKGTYTYACLDYKKNKDSNIIIASHLFYDVVLIGDTIEKVKNDSIVIIKRKHLIIKYINQNPIYGADKVDTIKVR